MKRHLLNSILLFVLAGPLLGQDSIVRRIILIGDAGNMNKIQQGLIPDAASRIIPGKTTVLYLGNNIYTSGMPLSGNRNEPKAQEVLGSQFLPMRKKAGNAF